MARIDEPDLAARALLDRTLAAPIYPLRLHFRTLSISQVTTLRARLFVQETAAGSAQIDYGVKTPTTLASKTPCWGPWTPP